MPIPNAVQELIERFDLHRAAYHAGQYNEAQVRQEFINPFFAALGWDVYNAQGYSDKYKEVVHEDAIQVQGKSQAPDYAFRIGGQRVFFVEAKKPAVYIKEEVPPAYQLRRYAWSAKLPLSILTDFEEFAVYDCRAKPDKGDRAATARVMYLTYRDYAAHWDEIAALFSPEAIRKGALDRYAESNKAKKGTAEVDAAFLAEIEGWRDALAHNIALRNPGLTVRELNRAVQMTIDRLIFLRICEDRGIEPYGRLRDAAQNAPAGEVYGQLGYLFQQADDRYNSGLFHFKPEKGREQEPDGFTLGLSVDDKILKPIVTGLYYPDCPYEFSVLPADILGQVYEQFLGKVIRLTAGGRAKVEEKPEVKKAGGVYYTPTYIVDYIVRHTVGRLLCGDEHRPGKTPRQVWGSQRAQGEHAGSPLRILDPACGSGTFLLQAYQTLLDWYLEQYVADHPETHARQGRIAPALTLPHAFDGGGIKGGGDWRLTSEERKRILLTHIYGVDIDPQAVEVTRLSLLLKVLEGETGQAQQLSFAQERALPDLDRNIRCGNSLIGPDYYQGRQLALFDEEEMYRVNAFDWKAGFPEVFALTPTLSQGEREKLPSPVQSAALRGRGAGGEGGFDAVIGNPPYIRIQALKEWAPQEVEFYKRQYVSASKGNYDIYVVFVEKGLSLLKRDGRLGYILPHKFFNAQYGEPLRGLIARGKYLASIVHFGDQQIFANATTYTCLLFLDKAENEEFEFARVDDLDVWRSDGEASKGVIKAHKATHREWNFVVGTNRFLFDRLNTMPAKLKDIAHIFVGTQTSADTIFVLENCAFDGNLVVGVCSETNEQVQVESGIVKPFLRGKDIRRYGPLNATAYLICPYIIGEDDFRLMAEDELANKYPLAYSYLKLHKFRLSSREHGKFKDRNWFVFGYPKSMILFQRRKIVVPDYNNVASFTFDEDGHFYKTGYGVILQDGVRESPLYVLGLLNTRLLFSYLIQVGTTLRGGYVRFWTQYIEQLPIRTINFSDPADAARHERMVALVQTMLDLHPKLAAAKTPQARHLLQQQIEITDRQIDALVYELYNLSEEEIEIVESERL